MMAGIRGSNTRPELSVRRGLHALGFRYRLHNRRLPGKPDLALPRHNAVIFIHGCFWHRHDCPLFKWPQSRVDFWRSKIEGNRVRDLATHEQLRAAGWRVLTIWECALKGSAKLGAAEVAKLAAEWLFSVEPVGEIRGKDGDD